MPTDKRDADVLERKPAQADRNASDATILSARARAEMHRSVARLKQAVREMRDDDVQERERRRRDGDR